MQVFVLGMHRSGTSTVARILNMMGFYFGPEGIGLEPASDNEKGFWERRDVKELNDRLLKDNGASWSIISNFDIDRITEESKTDFLKNARQIIYGMDAHRPWMIKDPRNCLTFSLWEKTLEIPICIHVVRNPFEIAASLEKRNNFPIPFSLALWEKYQLEAIRASVKAKNLVVNYNDLMLDPVSVVKSLYEKLVNLGISGIRLPGVEEINSFVCEDFYHQRGGNINLDFYLTPIQSFIWRHLENGIIEKDSFEKVLGVKNKLLRDYEILFNSEKEIYLLKAEFEKKDATILHLRSVISDQEKLIKNLKINEDLKIQEKKESKALLKSFNEHNLNEIKDFFSIKGEEQIQRLEIMKQRVEDFDEKLLQGIEVIKQRVENFDEKLAQRVEVIKQGVENFDEKLAQRVEVIKQGVENFDEKLVHGIEGLRESSTNDRAWVKNHLSEVLKRNEFLQQELIIREQHFQQKNQYLTFENKTLEANLTSLYNDIRAFKNTLNFQNDELAQWQANLDTKLQEVEALIEKENQKVYYALDLHKLNLASWRWRLGNTVIRFIERILLREKVQIAAEHLTIVLNQSIAQLNALKQEVLEIRRGINNKNQYINTNGFERLLENNGELRIEVKNNTLSSQSFISPTHSGIIVDTNLINTALFFSNKSKLEKKLSITIVSPTTNIHGGTKRLLMIAKLLNQRGHKINFIRQYKSRKLDWFDLGFPIIDQYFNENSSIEELEHQFPDADVLISYGNNKANTLLNQLGDSKGKKFQLFMHFGIHDKKLDIQNARLSNFYNLCTTTWIRDQLVQYSNHKPQTIDFGVHNDQFFPTRSVRPLRIGTLYHVSNWKRTKDVLLAFKELRTNPEFGDLSMVLYGQERSPNLMDLDCEYYYDPSQDQIREIYSSCAIWITPSLFEGIGMCSVEAMLCKTPLITVDTGGSRDFCNNNNSLIIDKKSPKAISKAISELLKRPERASKMAELAYAQICNHTWTNSIDLLEQQIRQKLESEIIVNNESAKGETFTLTIGIPVHNQLNYVKNCLKSIEENTFFEYEILIIDDKSEAETYQFLRELENPRITYIRNEEQKGFPFNCNSILRFAKGNYICLLNSDTIVTKNWDKYLIEILQQNDKLGMVGPSTSYGVAKNYDSIAQQIEEVHFKRFEMSYQEIQNYSKKLREEEKTNWAFSEYLNGFCMMLKASIISDVGFFDTDFGLGSREEVQYVDRIREEGYQVGWVKGAYVHHYGHRSFASIKDSKALWEKNKNLYFKNKGLKRYIGITKKKIGFVYNAKNSSSTRKRTFEPLVYLQKFLNIEAIHYSDLNESFIYNHQIIILQRIGALNESIDEAFKVNLFNWIDKYQKLGKIFIYDIDDLVIHSQEDLPLKLMKKCNFITSSTLQLAEYLKQFNLKTKVLPNGIDVNRFKKAKPKVFEKNIKRIICFSLAGAGVELFDKTAELLENEIPGKFEFHIFSGEKFPENEFSNIRIHKNLILDELFGLLKSSDYLINWDSHSQKYFDKLRLQYNVQKEEEELFVNCKSGLKYYNAAISKTIFLTTKKPVEYQRIVKHGVTGFFIDSPKEAKDIIIELEKNIVKRKQVLQNAYENVICEFSMESTITYYLNFFSTL